MRNAPFDANALPLVCRDTKCINTRDLGALLGTDHIGIWAAYTKHADRFHEGVHFLRLVGDDLIAFKASTAGTAHAVATTSSRVTLWTLAGADLLAKLIGKEQPHA